MRATLETGVPRDTVASLGGLLHAGSFSNPGVPIDTRTLGVERPHPGDKTVRFAILDEAVLSLTSDWFFSTNEHPIFSSRRLSVAGEIADQEDECQPTFDHQLLAPDSVDSVLKTF